jgi:hypothetical protein
LICLQTEIEITDKQDVVSDLFNSIKIKPARTRSEIEKAMNVRWIGYKKYDGFEEAHLEQLDLGLNCTIFLAQDSAGEVLGTMRILDRRFGPIELESFIDVDVLMPHSPRSIAELTRFSIPADPRSRLIKHLFWKTYFDFCVKNSIDFMLVSGKESATKDYKLLCFSELENGQYFHSGLGNLPHFSYYLEIPKVPALYLERKHPMRSFFCELELSNIQLD